MNTQATRLACTAAVALALSLGLAAPLAAQSSTDTVAIARSEAPAGWSGQMFRGIAFALPPGWRQMTRDDESVIYFGGDVATRTGPGFGLMLEEKPEQTFSGSTIVDLGQVTFENGQVFRRISSSITESGVAMQAEILISLVPVAGDDHLLIVQSAYSGTLDPYRSVHAGILASLDLPAPGAVLREPVLGGAFVAPLEGEWGTKSPSDDEVLTYEQRDLAGEVTLYRYGADPATGYLNTWYLPSDVAGQPVTLMEQPALLYEWTQPSNRFSDGSDDDTTTRIFVFETCLPGPDTLAIGFEGLPSFYRSEQLARLLDAIEPARGDAPCGAANLPAGAVAGSPGARPDGLAAFQAGGAPAPTAPAAKAEGTALDGILTYSAPEGWIAMAGEDALTLMHPDGRGVVTVARGAAVLPPNGLAALVPPGRLPSFFGDYYMEWTQFGWPSTSAEFMDNGQPATGWHFLNISRNCLPGQEPVALYWAGIDRFLSGDTLRDLKLGLRFNWPEGMEECVLKDAGVGAVPSGLPTEPEPAPEPEPEPAPAAAPEPAPQPQPPVAVEAELLLPPPPPVMPAEEPAEDPDTFTEGEAGYTLYRNGRYGTFIEYPGSYFRAEPPPDSGDGRTFVSADGQSQFYVFAQYNALGLTQDEMMRQDIEQGGNDSVAYRKSGDGWYVLSGYGEGGVIYYRKVILDPSGLVQVFEIACPPSLKEAFDPVVTYMANSFGPGTSAGDWTQGVDPAWDDEVTKEPVRVDQLMTPARGTDLRKALMAAAREPIEAEIGQSIVFVASVLRTDGTWAYLQAVPHNPDGSPIDWAKTPFAAEMKKGVMSDTAMVLMRKVQGEWTVNDYIFGPTDVYWLNWANAYELDEALFMP